MLCQHHFRDCSVDVLGCAAHVIVYPDATLTPATNGIDHTQHTDIPRERHLSLSRYHDDHRPRLPIFFMCVFFITRPTLLAFTFAPMLNLSILFLLASTRFLAAKSRCACSFGPTSLCDIFFPPVILCTPLINIDIGEPLLLHAVPEPFDGYDAQTEIAQ
jgi:hypothetical protein